LQQSWELEVNKQYEVFLTTAMGMIRYRLQDVVKCTGFYNRAPKLEFCYKVGALLLHGCSITHLELQQMLNKINFKMLSYWYFACDARRNKLILVIDDQTSLHNHILDLMHTTLLSISEKYAQVVNREEILPIKLVQLPKEELLSKMHAQFKPNLISLKIVDYSEEKC
jgi:hypothetical protein